MHERIEDLPILSTSRLSLLLLFDDLNFLIDAARILRENYSLTLVRGVKAISSFDSGSGFDAIIVESAVLDKATSEELSRFCQMREQIPTIELNAYHFHDEMIGSVLSDIILQTLYRFHSKRARRLSIH